MSEPAIERGVPIPDKRNGGRRRMNHYKPLLMKMRRGDSIFFPGRSSSSVWMAGFTAFGSGNYTVRKENGGARIWRL
jgi:hypothetical protein